MKSLVETDSGEEVDKIVYKKFTQICPMDALWQVETGHAQKSQKFNKTILRLMDRQMKLEKLTDQHQWKSDPKC